MSNTPTISNTVSSALREIPALSATLTLSLRRPGRRTLSLIDKALSYLTPFESPLARTASQSERRDLLDLLCTHRTILSPYIDINRVECNLRAT